MAEYRVQGESLTAVADPIRELSGVTDLLSLAGMTEKVDEANAEVTTQAGLMEQIKTALEGKAGGGGGIIPEGTLEITENGTYDVTQYAEANVNVPGTVIADNERIYQVGAAASEVDQTKILLETSAVGALTE